LEFGVSSFNWVLTNACKTIQCSYQAGLRFPTTKKDLEYPNKIDTVALGRTFDTKTKEQMNKFILRAGFAGLLAIALAGTPLALRAQTNTTATPKKKVVVNRVLPFHGKLKAIDNSAKTISVGNETIQITSETKITKLAKPATLADGAVGDDVAGSYRKEADGKWMAVSLRFGPKPPEVDEAKTNKTKKP